MSCRYNINVLIRYTINIMPFIRYLFIIIYYSFINNRMDIIGIYVILHRVYEISL